ncbi:MAG: PAS domain S-box protein [Dehalococcoidales bacterium]|nr:PAS domain S-box protein [Dehalococcoidales bacterium]
MSLRTKTYIIVFAVFITAFIVLVVLLGNFIRNGYTREENQMAYDKTSQARSVLENEVENLESLTMDWAEWDETYRFALDRNTDYISSNFDSSAFFNNRLNLCVLMDQDGLILYSGAYDLISGEETNFPQEFNSYLEDGSPLLNSPETGTLAGGIVFLASTPFIVASNPILTSEGDGPDRGIMILGRALDSVALGRLPVISLLHPQVYHTGDAHLPDDVKEIIPSLSGSKMIAVQSQNDDMISGYFLMKDIYGQPAVIVKTDSPRSLYAQVRGEINYFNIALLAFGLLFIMVIVIILEKMVLSRIANLSTRVKDIGKKGDLSSRIYLRGRDEVSSLAGNINSMLENLEHSRKRQQESETFNSALLKDSPNPIEVMNPDGSIRYVNPALERLTGYSQAQLIGRKPPFPWWINENVQQYLVDLQDIITRGAQRIERHYQGINGEPFWVDITSSPIKEGDETLYVIANWVDITERKRADEAIRQSEKRFRELAELLPELVFETDLNGKLTFVNRVVFSVFGYSPRENEKLTLIDLIAFEDREKARQSISNIIAGEDVDEMEYQAVRKDRRKFPCFINAIMFRDSLGKPAGLRGILVNITVQKEYQAEIRASEAFSSSLLSNAPNPIIVLNQDSTIRYINPALENLTGYSSSEVIGTSIPRPWWPESKREEYLSEFEEGKNSGQKGLERCYQKKSGELLWVKVTVSPFIENGQLQYYIGNWVDITAQKTASEEMAELFRREKNLTEALQAEIASRTEFTRALVHELKTPLTPIMVSSELLSEELTEEPLMSLAKNVFRGAQNMNRRVDELLDLARGEVGMLKLRLNPVDPEKLLWEVVKYMEPAVKSSGQTLAVTIAENLPVITADDDRIRQILFNLISNSIKYSLPGGQISIVAYKNENELVIEVHDTGRGMSREEQKKLFQPYYRIEGRERLSGLGLGLALSKKLVELQNGRIWVKSQKGKGSIFAFALPLSKDTPIIDTAKIGGRL